jgi:N-acetyl-anhydromuramyl-L-alanine amidase AmpD
MEAPENVQTAENVANYFKTTGTKASAHVCVDNNSIVRCVDDRDTAWAAPGANADGLQLELAGYARQSRTQWLDDYSEALLKLAAQVTADWCRKYNLPTRRLTRDELKAGRKGITSHADVSAVYKRSDHTDPGSGFPWDYFLAAVKGKQQPLPLVTENRSIPAWPGRFFILGVSGQDVLTWQRQMRQRGWSLAVDGVYGPQSRGACILFQEEFHLDVDGIVGPVTWRAAWTEPVK